MANSRKKPSYPVKFFLPAAIPPTPCIPRIPTPKLFLQTATEECQNLHKLLESALVEWRQAIQRTVNTITANNPFVQRMMCLSNQYKNLFQGHWQRKGHTNRLSSYNFAAILPGDSVAGMVVTSGVLNFLNIYNTLLIARLVLTWFPNSPPQLVNPLSTLCDPYLNVFRGLIPPLGGLDFSPILAFFLLDALTNAAAALPAELPKGMETMQGSASIPIQSSNLTEKQKLWLKRRGSSSGVQKKDDRSN